VSSCNLFAINATASAEKMQGDAFIELESRGSLCSGRFVGNPSVTRPNGQRRGKVRIARHPEAIAHLTRKSLSRLREELAAREELACDSMD
jgi:hypothetical protein